MVRVAILDVNDKVCGLMDPYAPDALHYYDDDLHQYLQGSTSTFSFKADARHDTSLYLVEGHKISFLHKEKAFYLTIMRVVRDEMEVEVEAYSTNLELLNEQTGAYTAPKAMNFAEYIDVFDFENVLSIGVNEVSDKSIKHEWEGSDTILARLFSLANVFSAEIEFQPILNDDYSLSRIQLNVYREHTDTNQGVGKKREDITLRYNINLNGVRKTSDITDLYTAIRPTGTDGLMLTDFEKIEYDENGNIEYICAKGDNCIRAVQARDRFPSTIMTSSDSYIVVEWDYDTDNVNTLYGQSLAQLKKNCAPQVEYEIEGYFDLDVGDTVMIVDEDYNPPLYLQARVTEQVISLTDESRGKTILGNFVEQESQIDSDLISRMQALINANKTYSCSIVSNNGVTFKNGEGTTTLTAVVIDGATDISDTASIQWYMDDKAVATGRTLQIKAETVLTKTVCRYEVTNPSGQVKGVCEVTVFNIADGIDGTDSSKLDIESSNGIIFKEDIISTTLSVVVTYGNRTITDKNALMATYGTEAYLQWLYRGEDDESFNDIPASDKRVQNDGFALALSSEDIDSKTIFKCDLMV